MHSKGGEDWALDMRSKEREEVRTQLISLCGVGPKVRQTFDYGSLGPNVKQINSSPRSKVMYGSVATPTPRVHDVGLNPSIFRLFCALAYPPVSVLCRPQLFLT